MRTLLVMILMLMAGTTVSAQEYRFHKYRVEHGLPSDVIKAVAQDSLGFIWIATDDGLVKCDGHGFQTYKAALHSQYAKGFLKTRSGRLLAIGDLDLIEIQNLVDTVIFKQLIRGTRTPTDSTVWYAKALYEDRNDDVWIAEPQSVLRYRGDTFERFDFGAENRSPVFTRSYNFFEDNEGNLYTVAYMGRIYRFDTSTQKFKELRQKLPPYVNHVLFDRGKLLIASKEGLYEASLRKGELEVVQRVLPIENASHLLQVDSLLWLSTFNEDIYKIDDRNYSTLETLLYNFTGINHCYSSPEGDLWVSTDKGLVLVQRNQFIVADINSQTHFIEGITNNPADNSLYYCSKESLVKLVPAQNNSWDHQEIYNNPDSYFQCLQYDTKGLWASTSTNVLLFRNDKLLRQWNFANEGNFVHDLFIDSHKNVWISQAGSHTLKVISDSLTLKYIDLPVKADINLVREGPLGIYAASSGDGTYLYFKPHGSPEFTNISLPLPFTTANDLDILDLAVQGDVLWLASTDGLLRHDGKVLQRINLGESMTKFVVSSIEVLNERYILFSNSYGLLRYDVVTGDYWLYDENAGLPSNTITDHGILVDSRERIWIGTSYGLAWGTQINPAQEPTLTPYCVGAQANGESIRYMDGLYAAYGSFLNLQFSSITFPENKITMQFKLDNDSTWRIFHHNEVSLSGLTAGKHTLQVRARKNTGRGWSKPVVVSIRIGKPYWQRAEFVAAVLLTALLIAWASFAISSRIMRKRREHLQNLIDERTRDLLKANEELLLRNSELDRFVYSASHDLSAPLKSILGLIMVARLDNTVEGHAQYLSMMERSVRKLEEFIEEVVSYSRNTRMPVKMETFAFEPFINNILADHQYSPNYDKIRFIVECAVPNITSDVTRLKIILNNLVSNAIKFHWQDESHKPFVKICLSQNHQGYQLLVQDNGYGIEAKHLDNIFDMFYRATDRAQGSGLGLYILKESVVKLGGTVKAISRIDEGTTFVITLPVTTPH